ncbi:MAG: ABC transporter permease [Chloroflexi bacterium]|nr:ABC transporter permease [Chloroflexota bacterium]
MLADLIYGTPTSLEIGVIAGVFGVTLGALMGLIAGYAGGIVDEVIRIIVDILLTIPSLMILIIVASMLGAVSVEAMALIIAALAWMWPARAVRAQVLTIRERMYVQVARFNGASNLRIIIGELLPNLVPYLAANLVGAISGGILASVGLSTLGLGPMTRPSLGLTFYWAITYGALIRQMWWWFMPPIIIIIILFLGLFLMSQGLDQITNPRLQSKA